MIEIKKEKRNVFNAQKCKQILAKGNEQKIVLLLFFSFTFRNFSHILFYCSLASVIYIQILVQSTSQNLNQELLHLKRNSPKSLYKQQKVFNL